ncbi:hypothetical protein HMPREF6745_1572 [Prevotella sp. oral taxon 472 str. F0295]|nr:hypothetical protein HMPREF6745_1572 [Prevotella sp. oral taxon 472 str. F0295]
MQLKRPKLENFVANSEICFTLKTRENPLFIGLLQCNIYRSVRIFYFVCINKRRIFAKKCFITHIKSNQNVYPNKSATNQHLIIYRRNKKANKGENARLRTLKSKSTDEQLTLNV